MDVNIPSEQELLSLPRPCTQRGCSSVFQCASNLRMHLVKHHKIEGSLQGKSQRFACPVFGCSHSINTNKYFKSFKLVKQHYIKCHSLKEFKCSNCPKGFAREYLLRAHEKSCGKVFKCCCGWEYNTREALLTHCKRKLHKAVSEDGKTVGNVLEKQNKRDEKLVQVCIASTTTNDGNPGELTVFPHYVAAIALSELSRTFIIPKNCHTSVQTVAAIENKSPRSSRQNDMSTRETQTGKNSKKSAETQTNVALSRQSCTKCTVKERGRRKSTETQTKDLLPFLSEDTLKVQETLECFSDSSMNNTDVVPKKLSLNDYSMWATSKSYPDNGMSSFDRLCNNETQTEIDALFQPDLEGMSSAETQTTDDLIEDLYSHMCTQTTDLFDFSWVDTSDNQTQTAWPDM